MSFILGFGSVEEQARATIKEELLAADDVAVVYKKYMDAGDKYKKMSRTESPERYTYFFCYDGKIVFHHINRRHPFSPDGWALWIVEEEFPLI